MCCTVYVSDKRLPPGFIDGSPDFFHHHGGAQKNIALKKVTNKNIIPSGPLVICYTAMENIGNVYDL